MKYILIREYPGSPKLGTIVEEDDGAYYIPDDNSKLTFTELDHYPYAYPEFWQEVVEKDYLILSLFFDGHFYELSNKKLNKIEFKYLSKTIDGHCALTDLNIKFEDSEMNVKIHSIKRLSDSEIFTIGDSVELEDDGKYEGKIYTIFIAKTSKRKGQILLSGLSEYGEFHNIGLIEAIKYKTPLFTTEDGVDIFEGDKYYSVEKHIFYNHGEIIAQKAVLSHDMSYWELNKNVCFLFSTKEKAEEYILMNKPILSLNDIFKNVEEMRKGLKTFETSKIAKNLKVLVKQKLNNKN